MASYLDDMTDDELRELKDKIIKQRAITGGHGKRAWLTERAEACQAVLDERAMDRRDQ